MVAVLLWISSVFKIKQIEKSGKVTLAHLQQDTGFLALSI
jgi:hypothetical protein